MILNPVFLESVAFLGASALALGIVAVAALGLWRAINDERPLLLSDVLALEGVDMGAHLNGVGARLVAVAARLLSLAGAAHRCERERHSEVPA